MPLGRQLFRGQRPHKHEDPADHGFWNPPCIGPPNDLNVGSLLYVVFGALAVGRKPLGGLFGTWRLHGTYRQPGPSNVVSFWAVVLSKAGANSKVGNYKDFALVSSKLLKHSQSPRVQPVYSYSDESLQFVSAQPCECSCILFPNRYTLGLHYQPLHAKVPNPKEPGQPSKA